MAERNSETLEIDRNSLEQELAKTLAGEVRFDTASLGLYATDSSNFRQIPIGVVIPKSIEDVVIAHRVCSKYGAPIVNRGGGTSLSGETVNFAVAIDHSKYLRNIEPPDAGKRLITVEAGAINEAVNETAMQVGMVFGPDPSSHRYCTIGGNVGNNSCGIHSVQSQLYGPGPRTSDNVHSMEVVTYEGTRIHVGVNEEQDLDAIIAVGDRKAEIYDQLRELRDRYADQIRSRFPSLQELPRRVSGYNLDELLPEKGFNVARALVGTEGTCATALNITLQLTPALPARKTAIIAYDDIIAASQHVMEILQWKPVGLEAIDHLLFEDESQKQLHPLELSELPRGEGHAWLMVEFGADEQQEVDQTAEEFRRWLIDKLGYQKNCVAVFSQQEHGENLWLIREAGLGATAFPPDRKNHWPGWEDSAVPPGKIAPYLRDLKKLYKKYDLRGAIYGHLGQGCIHSRISFDLQDAEGLRRYREFLDEASDLVVSYGGSLSGEHGDGQQRAEFLEKQFGTELVAAMREFKQIWDPTGKMNPGKVVAPYRVDENLKLGADYDPPQPETKFAYPEDNGKFAHATLRCVGVGKCRQPQGAEVMCPSYIVTKEEKHSTRGRARLLFEMLQGDVVKDGWQSEEVHDALDLCLACKGCTNDCPVNVDIPTYKSEFLYHYYQGWKHNRKRYMYAFGFIDQAARLAAWLPGVANFFTQTPGFAQIAKFVAGIDSRRQIPKFASTTLQTWFRKRGGSKRQDAPSVLLWPDTFNNHLHLPVGIACVDALEAAGFQVKLPETHVCCGRPLYDYGFLDRAEKYLRHTLANLQEHIDAGTPIVGMEPSCIAVFKNELKNLLPNDKNAQKLSSNVYHWADFFIEKEVELPQLDGKAIVWGHCHQKATGGTASQIKLLEKMGLEVEEAHGGCCGLAGSFGFENGKYDISMDCAEVGFLPAVRQADDDTLIVADGFSCKTQLAQSDVPRTAMHTAEVMALAQKRA